MARNSTYTSYTLKKDPVTNPLDKLPPILKNNLDRNLCVCNEVLKMDIINAIANGATTVGEVKKQTYATDGIGCCTKDVERLIECLCSSETDSPETEK
jgi:bacterioferritin-associated ferredoxin